MAAYDYRRDEPLWVIVLFDICSCCSVWNTHSSIKKLNWKYRKIVHVLSLLLNGLSASIALIMMLLFATATYVMVGFSSISKDERFLTTETRRVLLLGAFVACFSQIAFISVKQAGNLVRTLRKA